MRVSTLKKGCSDVPIRATGNIHCDLYIPTSNTFHAIAFARVTIPPYTCHDPASVVSRSCLSCVTILPQLCRDPASVVSRSCPSCVTSF